jgi:hypothetical protein
MRTTTCFGVIAIALAAGCARGPGPQWRIAVENLSTKAAEASVVYSVEGGTSPGKQTATDEANPKKHVSIAEGHGNVTVESATFLIGSAKRRGDGPIAAKPGQTITITLGTDEKVTMRVE